MAQLLVNAVCAGFTLSLVALGFGLIYYSTGIFHVAHGAVYTLASYCAWFLLVHLGLGTLAASAGAVVAAATAGWLIERIVYRPLTVRSASPAVVLISSLGLHIVLVNTIALIAGNEVRILRPGVGTTLGVAGTFLTVIQVYQAAVGAAVALFLWVFLSRTSVGRLCRAMADDPELLSLLGIDQYRLRGYVFAGGSTLAAVGAVLASLDVGTDPQGGLSVLLGSAVACIIGGHKRFLAPVAGALVLAAMQHVIVWYTSARWRHAVTFGLLLGFLAIRGQGIFASPTRLEER